MLAADHVARQAADGYTLVVMAPSTVSARFQIAKPPFDIWKDFTLIAPCATLPMALLSSARLPANTAQELVALVAAKPGQFQYGSYGVAASNNLAMQMFMKGRGLQMVHVPYKDAAQMYVDLMRGEIHCMLDTPGAHLPGIRSGQVKVLAMGTDTRDAGLPEVPTLSETVLPGFVYPSWFGLAGPASMPDAVVERITRELNAIAQEEAVVRRMQEVHFAPLAGNASTLKTMMQNVERDYDDALRAGTIPRPA